MNREKYSQLFFGVNPLWGLKVNGFYEYSNSIGKTTQEVAMSSMKKHKEYGKPKSTFQNIIMKQILHVPSKKF